ncbi:exo-poly-alpha-D-galacturonosidase [Puia dinghuensis]|uniref:Exo-poly-alpha-D-galacturonosidase n=2 Tax=Puia dinghuensis TaxID=1792502 RepID=A0A8J2XTH4_9BACT|nr:exo-poly-alpha-D-galacturonosidase [Puia dinghuensis]
MFVLVLATDVAVAGGPSFVITHYGAKGDGKTMNTRAIQRAIDAAAAAGGGIVVVPSGKFLTGVITLKSGVELHLAADAVLLGSTRRSDYGGERASALIVADGQQGIAITGGGVIDGEGREVVEDVYRMLKAGTLQDPDWQKENPWHQKRPNEYNRPGIIHFTHCTNVRLDSVLLKDAACWVQTYTECDHLSLTNLRVQSTAYWNNDGIDVVDCKDVQITGCVVNADDDGICLKSSNPASRCENILVAHCDVRSSASGIKFGTASFGGFKNITIKDVTVHDTYRSALALECVDGGAMENVTVENVAAVNTGNALFIRLGHRNQQLPPGSVRHVTIKNLHVEVPAGKPDKGYEMEGPEMGYAHNFFPASIVGIPGHPVEDVVFENVEIVYKGVEDKSLGRYGLDSLAYVPENESAYPEYSMFGELPAWGLYVRHVSGLQLRQVTLRHQQESFRPAMVFDDVKGVSVEGAP